MKSISIFVPLLTAALVSAHGFVSNINIDGKSYKGNVPRGAKNPSIIRQINSIDPVKGAHNAAVNCGPGATAAANVAEANPGSSIAFTWATPNGRVSKPPTYLLSFCSYIFFYSGRITQARC